MLSAILTHGYTGQFNGEATGIGAHANMHVVYSMLFNV
jgi:hypothetical protein